MKLWGMEEARVAFVADKKKNPRKNYRMTECGIVEEERDAG